MPHSTQWYADGLLRTYSGVVTGAELVQAVGETYGDERFDCLCYLINDFTAIEALNLERRDLGNIVAQQFSMADRRKRPIRFAVVARRELYDDAIRDYVERVIQRGVPWTVNVFDTLAEAQAWASKSQ